MSKPDIVIRNGSVIDGTGAPARNADVAITDGMITAVNDKIDDTGTREIDAEGHTLSFVAFEGTDYHGGATTAVAMLE